MFADNINVSDHYDPNLIYDIVPDSKNIITSLIDNLQNDTIFQKRIKKLESSSNNIEIRKSKSIKNSIGNIRVFNTKSNPLFLAKDIGIILDIFNINTAVSKFEPHEKVVGHIANKNKIKKVVFLTKSGVFRCVYRSKSPFARLLTDFISNLVDYMITYESKLLKKISDKFKIENPELIEKGMDDLQNKLIEYEKKIADEQEKVKILEIQYESERQKRQESETVKLEYEILSSFDAMRIEQLKQDNKYIVDKFNNINQTDELPNDKELQLLKENYMKPVYIYVLYPEYLIRQIKTKRKDTPDDTSVNDTLFDVYEKNFNHIFGEDNKIDNDELLYYHMGFGRNISKDKKLICVSVQYVANKIHFTNLINSLNKTCTYIELKHNIYKTSLDEICDTIQDEFLKLFNIQQ